MEYTKGEWKVDERVGCIAVYTQEQYDKANCSPCIGDADKYAIHFKHGYQGKNGWEISPEDVANAHLIAKSPRMAQLLKRLVDDGWNASISEEAKEIIETLDLS